MFGVGFIPKGSKGGGGGNYCVIQMAMHKLSPLLYGNFNPVSQASVKVETILESKSKRMKMWLSSGAPTLKR